MGALPSRPQTMAALPNRPQTMGALPARPQTAGSLPSRNTIRTSAAQTQSAPALRTPPPVRQPGVVPGGVPGVPDGDNYGEERLGPIGITIGVVAACALVWIVAVWMKLI